MEPHDGPCDECGHPQWWPCHGEAKDQLISVYGGEAEFPHPYHAPGTGGLWASKQVDPATPAAPTTKED